MCILPALIPTVKDLASHVTVDEAEQIVREVLKLTTTAKVQRYLSERLRALAPNLELLEAAD